ncbi:hypothetical protein AcV7_003797 [Taiwanofungus camphoratus]|nr:hypothetical protein AcV7_003797 [Antrodia cinnamomea]
MAPRASILARMTKGESLCPLLKELSWSMPLRWVPPHFWDMDLMSPVIPTTSSPHVCFVDTILDESDAESESECNQKIKEISLTSLPSFTQDALLAEILLFAITLSYDLGRNTA